MISCIVIDKSQDSHIGPTGLISISTDGTQNPLAKFCH